MVTTPKQQGFFFPAEWHPHRATWLSFPQSSDSWDYGERLERIYPSYMAFIKAIAESEKVCINAKDKQQKSLIINLLDQYKINHSQIEIPIHTTNDSWCRDHGPAFLINPETRQKMIVEWGYNAWGGKYPPYGDDDEIPIKIANYLGLPYVVPGIIMEGGSVEFNGKGTVLTSKSCLLNLNRNPHLNQQHIEQYLYDYYGVDQVLWVTDGIVGDDTDGHIDDTTRFVNEDTVLTVIEHDKTDDNYHPLKQNLADLTRMRLLNGKQLNIKELPMPEAVYDSGIRLPASYANFLITNGAVIVPTYNCDKDDTALDIIQGCFPDRKIIGIDATEIIWGLGSFHCLSQQEPIV
ncbi:agmatine/peptidylarginine deiminase [Emticicia sp. BO119]|uniref:agmatine deiminase family protein n=1 Tax=Emticicia sp. BO119 TaxID=2757768 RepID=UPI0015F0A477|nr:agmatine deiminase family protein [Emticicia sp. BO119]MBA4854082.1 agmatine deiminase family protein [Emticicia sp. BO119]